MNKAEIFYDAITGIREQIVEEAQDYRFARRSLPWRRYAGWAACLALVVCLGYLAAHMGMGGSSSDSASSNSSPSPGDYNMDSSTDNSGDETAAAPEDTDGGSALERETFTATVLEVHDTYLLVEPAEGAAIRASADRVIVPIGDLAEPPAAAAGDTVAITYAGDVEETYPARIAGVEEVSPVEGD